jgi:hypothetical protein
MQRRTFLAAADRRADSVAGVAGAAVHSGRQWFVLTAMRPNLVTVVKAPLPIFWGARKA